MTRFARAKGSKSSNEKLPEESTSWQVMKQQLQQKYQESKNSENVKENELKASDDAWNSGSTTWADIENSDIVNSKCHSDKMLKKPNKKFQMSNSNIKSQKKHSKKHSELNFFTSKQSSDKIKQSTDSANNLDGNQGDRAKTLISKRKKKHQKPKDVEQVDTGLFKGKKKKHEKQVEIDTAINETDELGLDTSEKKKKKRKKRGHSDENSVKSKEVDFEPENFSDAESPGDLMLEVNNSDSYLNKKEKNTFRSNNSNIEENKQQSKKNKNEETSTFYDKQYNRNNNSSNTGKKRKFKDLQQKNVPFKRRKPDEQVQIFHLNGRSIEIVKYDGFPVKKEDAENLKVLKQSLIAKGIPKDEIQVTMKLERRKAEKSLAREKKKNCFHCRMSGHVLSECPELENKESHESTIAGICFKCGSTEHTHIDCRVVKEQDFRFAKCFVCNEQGHISRQCPDNPKGLYPNGGACRECGDVTHLKKDCPTLLKTKEETTIRLQTLDSQSLEKLDEEIQTSTKTENKPNKKKKVIKF